jgi:hypothetical protein
MAATSRTMKINGIIYDPRDFRPGDLLYLPSDTLRSERFRHALLQSVVTVAHAGGSIYNVGEAITNKGVPLTAQALARAIPNDTAGLVENMHIDQIGRVHVTLGIQPGIFDTDVVRRLGLSLTHAISHGSQIISPLEVALVLDPARKSCRVTNTLPHAEYLATMSDAAPTSADQGTASPHAQLPPRDPVTGKFTRAENDTGIPGLTPEMLQQMMESLTPGQSKTPEEPPENVVVAALKSMTPVQRDSFLAAFRKIKEKTLAESTAEKTELQKQLQDQEGKLAALKEQSEKLKFNGNLQSQLIRNFVGLVNPPEEERDTLTKSTEAAFMNGGAQAIYACSQRMMELRRTPAPAVPGNASLTRELEDLGLAAGMTAASSELGGAPPAKRQRTEQLFKANEDIYHALMS